MKTIVGDFLLGIFLCSKDLWSCFGVKNRQVCRYVDQINILEHGRWSSLPMFQVYPTFFFGNTRKAEGRTSVVGGAESSSTGYTSTIHLPVPRSFQEIYRSERIDGDRHSQVPVANSKGP